MMIAWAISASFLFSFWLWICIRRNASASREASCAPSGCLWPAPPASGSPAPLSDRSCPFRRSWNSRKRDLASRIGRQQVFLGDRLHEVGEYSRFDRPLGQGAARCRRSARSREWGTRLQSALRASRPSISGILMSRIARSGFSLEDQVYGLLAVDRLADHLKPQGLQLRLQAHQPDALVVGDDDPQSSIIWQTSQSRLFHRWNAISRGPVQILGHQSSHDLEPQF